MESPDGSLCRPEICTEPYWKSLAFMLSAAPKDFCPALLWIVKCGVVFVPFFEVPKALSAETYSTLFTSLNLATKSLKPKHLFFSVVFEIHAYIHFVLDMIKGRPSKPLWRKMSEPIVNKVMTTTNIAAKETQPFRQKFTNPAFITLFIFVKIIILLYFKFKYYIFRFSSLIIFLFHGNHSPVEESTTSLLCVAKTIVVPNLFIFSKILMTSLVLTGSRLPVGSSATTKSGCLLSLWQWPLFAVLRRKARRES